MAFARGFSLGFRRACVLLLIAVLAIVAGVPSPLRALDAAPLGNDLRLERLASQRAAVFAPESRHAKPLGLTHAVLPGNCLPQSPALNALAVVAEYAPASHRRAGGGTGCRAPPLLIPS